MISKLKAFSALLLLALAIITPLASRAAAVAPEKSGSNIYYYSATCGHCANVKKYFDKNNIVERFNIVSKEISQNPDNAAEFYDALTFRNVPPAEMGVPYLIFEGQALSGDKDIIAFFKAKIGDSAAAGGSGPAGDSPASGSSSGSGGLTVWAVVIAALADSINPCAFSVIVFLLLSLLAIGARKRMMKVGLTYVVTVYIVYLAAGLGLLAAFQSVSFISQYILYAAAILAILAGLVNIKDFFFYGKGFTLSIPASRKAQLDKYIKHASIPASIVLGFLVALFELPCTGGFYLAILALLSRETTFWSGFAYLAFYNLIFVAPLLIIIAIVYKGVSPQKLESWRLAKRTWLRLIMGLVLVGLGLALIFIF